MSGHLLWGNYVPAYPDNSPTVEDFQKMGISDLQSVWKLKDFEQIISLLDEIYEQDKLSLPRYNSEFSGRVFEKMTSLENFDWFLDKNINIGKRILEFEKYKRIPARFTLYYIEENEDFERFGAEVLECNLLEAHVSNIGKQLYDELKNQIGDKAHMGNFSAGYDMINQEYINGIERLVRLIEVDYLRFDEEAISVFANKLFFFISSIEDDKIRKQLKIRIKELDRTNVSASIKEIINELKQQL